MPSQRKILTKEDIKRMGPSRDVEGTETYQVSDGKGLSCTLCGGMCCLLSELGTQKNWRCRDCGIEIHTEC